MKFTERILPNRTSYITYQEHLNRYAFASKFVSNKLVLDIACGTGYGSFQFADAHAKMAIGGDVSKDAVEYASSRYSKSNLDFIRLDAAELPFRNRRFDVIVSFETIEHLNQLRRFLFECKRLLKNDGMFICSTPNKKISSPRTEKPLNPFHVKELYVKEFHKLLSEYFTSITLFGQHYIGLKTKITLKLLGMERKVFSTIPRGGREIIGFVKKRFLRSSTTQSTAKQKGTEISSRTLDKRYAVLPFRDTLIKTPSFVIATARVRKCQDSNRCQRPE